MSFLQVQILQVETLDKVKVGALVEVEVVTLDEVEIRVLLHPCLQSSISEGKQQ